MPQGEDGRAELARDRVQRTTAVTAADIAAVDDAVGDELKRGGLVADFPRHTECLHLRLERADRRLELPLLHRHRHDLIGERRTALMRDQRVQQAEAVFPAGDTDRDTIAGPQHREAPHGAADEVEDGALDVTRVERHLRVDVHAPYCTRCRSFRT